MGSAKTSEPHFTVFRLWGLFTSSGVTCQDKLIAVSPLPLMRNDASYPVKDSPFTITSFAKEGTLTKNPNSQSPSEVMR